MPTLSSILETALYVDDLNRARAFYETVLDLPLLRADHRMCAFDVGGKSVLLLFLRGASAETMTIPGGTIPPHDGRGPCTWHSPSRPRTFPPGKGAWRHMRFRWKAAPPGRGAGRASISATRTGISSNSPRRGCGRRIEANGEIAGN